MKHLSWLQYLLSRLIFSTAFGVLPATLPLCFVEQSFCDVNTGVIELAKSMKVSNYQLVRYFLIVESRQSLVLGLTSSIISIISYSTVMGIVGGGGIGDYAIRYGYYEFNMQVVYKAILCIVILVFTIQILGKKGIDKLWIFLIKSLYLMIQLITLVHF